MSSDITPADVSDLTRRLAEAVAAAARIRRKLQESDDPDMARHIEGIEDSLDAALVLVRGSAQRIVSARPSAGS